MFVGMTKVEKRDVLT